MADITSAALLHGAETRRLPIGPLRLAPGSAAAQAEQRKRRWSDVKRHYAQVRIAGGQEPNPGCSANLLLAARAAPA